MGVKKFAKSPWGLQSRADHPEPGQHYLYHTARLLSVLWGSPGASISVLGAPRALLHRVPVAQPALASQLLEISSWPCRILPLNRVSVLCAWWGCAGCCHLTELPSTTFTHSELFSWCHGHVCWELSPGLQHGGGSGTAGTVGRRTGTRDSKVLGNHQPSAVDCLQSLYPHIPCKALFMACFNFVPAQCSSVKPWNRWSPLRRLLPRQKPRVHAQAGSAFRRDGYTSTRQLVPAALRWAARCFEDALVLSGWGPQRQI